MEQLASLHSRAGPPCRSCEAAKWTKKEESEESVESEEEEEESEEESEESEEEVFVRREEKGGSSLPTKQRNEISHTNRTPGSMPVMVSCSKILAADNTKVSIYSVY